MVRGNHTHERSDITNWTHSHVEDTGWINLTLINGWAPFDAVGTGRIPQIRRLNGVTYTRGVIKSGASGVAAFVIDEGFRPGVQAPMEISPVQASSGGVAYLNINAATGQAFPTNGPTGSVTGYMFIDASWPADS